MEAACLRPQAGHRDARRIVDVDLGLGQDAERMPELAALGVRQVAGAQPGRLDAGLGGEQPGGELGAGHLQAEDRAGRLESERRVRRHPERQACIVGDDVVVGDVRLVGM